VYQRRSQVIEYSLIEYPSWERRSNCNITNHVQTIIWTARFQNIDFRPQTPFASFLLVQRRESSCSTDATYLCTRRNVWRCYANVFFFTIASAPRMRPNFRKQILDIHHVLLWCQNMQIDVIETRFRSSPSVHLSREEQICVALRAKHRLQQHLCCQEKRSPNSRLRLRVPAA